MWNGAVRTAVCQKADAGTDKGRIYCKTDDSEKRREEFCETDGGGSGERKWGHGTGHRRTGGDHSKAEGRTVMQVERTYKLFENYIKLIQLSKNKCLNI